jgi:predicted HicB family RNase H-like nuclease
MKILKKDHGVVGYMDESFTAPEIVVQALKSNAAIHKALVGTDQTQKSLDDRNLLDYLAESETNDGKLKGCCIFASEGNQSHKYTSNISKYSGKPSLRVDEVRPAKWLAPGVSDEAKQHVQQELEQFDKQLTDLQPAVESGKTTMIEYQAQAQQAMQRLKNANENMKNLRRMMEKLKNAEIKLQECQEACEVDDEEEKKQKIGMLNKRITHSLLALEAQAESYKQMMIATIQSSGARLNRENVVAEERRIK